ncbi:serine hydrolase domain-containing protein [Rhodoferax fermentans]|uniref:Serine hydrolase n=1 Tax=Rhodoferax fermentans TaxID=28066 RepID=A0A1T1APK9_RHOFE|nr:serine hydrolase [Rhodoferax fermentans]MBK1682662.1 serine hydrolase [Rhodoferax fermentans]OOV06042.1 serine hydrolase [Rhodoferax fermentans]
MTLQNVSPEKVGLSSERLARLMAVLQREVADQRLPGAVAVVARHGKLALMDSVGQLNPRTGEAMHNDARFRIYSMTKPIVSVAAMMLVEQGRLLLADPVAKYLPEFAQQNVAMNGEATELQPVMRDATVHDLLRHTAGLTYEFLGSGPVQRQYAQLRLGSRDRSLADFTQQLAALPLMYQPGQMFEYSRATDVLGRVIEVISAQPLQQFLQEQLFEPLRMPNTAFTVPPEFHDHIAEPFARDPDGGLQMKVIDVRTDATLASGGGGLISTAQDYARFLHFLLNRGELDGVRLLGPRTVDFMTTDHLGDIPVAPGGSRALLPAGHGFGLGFAVRKHLGVAPVPGSVGTYFWGGLAGTSFFVDPALDMFACLMLQAPNQREYYRMLFRDMVYAALLD